MWARRFFGATAQDPYIALVQSCTIDKRIAARNDFANRFDAWVAAASAYESVIAD